MASEYYFLHPPALKGLILAGGKSTRMGTDKGLLNYHGKTQREWLVELLKPYCSGVYVSINDKQTTHLPHIIDRQEEIGPLAGILTAFETDATVAWLVVACDMPFLNTKLVEELIANRNPNCMATVFQYPQNQRIEPLFAIYEPAIFTVLQENIQQGNLSPQKILHTVALHTIPIADELALCNINTPQ